MLKASVVKNPRCLFPELFFLVTVTNPGFDYASDLLIDLLLPPRGIEFGVLASRMPLSN